MHSRSGPFLLCFFFCIPHRKRLAFLGSKLRLIQQLRPAQTGGLDGLFSAPGGNLGVVAPQQHLRHLHVLKHPGAGILGIFQQPGV